MALDILAGSLGGCAGTICGHPFDTVKVRVQSLRQNGKYPGTFRTLYHIIKTESIFGVFKGLSSPLYSQAFINATVFGVQAITCRMLPNPDSIASHGMAGAIAGFVQTLIVSPTELVKTRLQLQGVGQKRDAFLAGVTNTPGIYRSAPHCLMSVYRTGGITGVYRGFWITQFREVPAFAVYFASYQWLLNMWGTQRSQIPTSVILLDGGIAGCISWMATYPMDVIKTRYQADKTGIYKNAWNCAMLSVKGEGFSVLFKGLNSTLIRAFPTNAATFTTIEWVHRLYFNYKLRNEDSFETINV